MKNNYYILDEDIGEAKLFSETNYQIIQINYITELNKNNLVIYVFDNMVKNNWNNVFKECKKRTIKCLFLYIQNKSIFLSSINPDYTIEDCYTYLKKHDKFHTLLFPDVYRTNDKRYEKKFIEFIDRFISMSKDENEKEFLTQITLKPINVTRIILWLDHSKKDQLIFNEHLLFNHKNIKTNIDKYHINNNLNYEYIKNQIVNFAFGICNHEYITLNSRFLPMVCAETKIKDYGLNNSFGRSFDYETCKLCALLENLERHFNSSNHQNRGKIYGSYNDFKYGNIIHPSKLCLHDKELHKHPKMMYSEFNEDKKIYWVWMWSVKNEDYYLVPEQYIYYIDSDDISYNTRFVYESSNGAALGSTLEEAVLHSCFELIERDNFLVHYFNKLEPIEIDIDKSELIQVKEVKLLLRKYGYSLHFYDISLELGIPTVWCLMIDNNDKATVKTYSAAGTNFNPESALISAMVEVVASLPIYEETYKEKKYKARREEIYNDYDKLTEFEDHVLLYSHNKAPNLLNFAINTTCKKTLQQLYPEWYIENKFKNRDLNEDLNMLFERILEFYDDILIADISGDKLDYMNLKCTKVIIPGLQPVYFGHQYRRLDIERILRGPVISGKREQSITKEDINQVPHPFP